MNCMYLVVTRDYSNILATFAKHEDAARFAEVQRVPCDVHAPSGALMWVWELRP